MAIDEDIKRYKASLIQLEKELHEALKEKDWAAIEAADKKIQATIQFWVDSISSAEYTIQREDAMKFIGALQDRYKTYLSKVTELKNDASVEIQNLQNKKAAIKQYIKNKF